MLVDFGTGDDAGVYKLNDDLAIVQTVDFFTPIVDDPYDFGRIAATNAFSDIYAMGATPLTALNVASFPIEEYGLDPLARILDGGASVANDAGVAIVGGHTIKGAEPTYGMAVTGKVHPDRIVANSGARPGDIVFLTKPLGTGILATALKREIIGEQQMADAVRWMTTLNAHASRAMLSAHAHAATDVTGYGLLGHAHEIARASNVRIRIEASKVPVLELVRDLVAGGIAPGGSRANAEEHSRLTDFEPNIPLEVRLILSDAQTSGGLLITLAAEHADILRDALLAGDSLAAQIGVVEQGQGLLIEA